MKQKLIGLSQRYVAALQKHLKGSETVSQPATAASLGREALAFGLKTLDLARIHEEALVTLKRSGGNDKIRQRAETFFAEAITPIEETHFATRKTKAHLRQLTEMLGHRTVELATANRQLQSGIARRKTMETALKKSNHHYARLLKDSLQLQENLRHLTHHVLAAQEAERHTMSRGLHNDIAQTLLGINARLLSLKQEGRNNSNGLKNEIANTQQLIVKSARSFRRLAREFRDA